MQSPAEDRSYRDVETPALLIDLDALERNLDRMREDIGAYPGVRLRPHAKTHKSPHVARLQMTRGGANGMCCQTIGEAEMLVNEASVDDVLLSNQLVTPGKIARLITLAGRSNVAVCIDNRRNIDDLSAAATAAGVRLRVLVEIEVGSNRCGVAPTAAAELARHIHQSPGLRFGGVHAYNGAAQHIYDAKSRREAIADTARLAAMASQVIRTIGLDCDLVTGGGTGSWPMEASSGVYNEIQPGSYVFMDADYARVEGPPGDFEHALFVLTSVISRRERHLVCDAGLKAHSIDSGPPLVFGRRELRFERASDEHTVFAAESTAAGDVPAIGEKLLLIPGHCDPTVNLYDRFACFRGGRFIEFWPISARGA